MFKAGDKVKIVCEKIGVIMDDPTKSLFSILVNFDGEIARIPSDGTLLGMKHIKLVKVEDEQTIYEHP